MGKKFNLEGVVPVNELGEAIEKPKLNLAGVIPVDEKGNEVKKKDQPSQLTQQPSINTSSSASGQSGQSSGQEGSALAILRKYAELSQTPGTAEYKMRQNEIARQKAAPQPLVEEKPVFDITQVDLPEMAQSSTVVTQKQAPSSVEELEKLKKQQEKYYAKAETAASATLYSKTGSVKKSDQYNWLYNASEDEREDFKNTLKSEGYGDKAIEQIFSKADTQAVSNLGQNKSSEFQDSIIKEMAPLKGVLSDAEFNKAFQDRISNKSLEYGIDQLDAYDKESYPIIKEWWDINNKLKDPNFTGPQRDKAIQTAIDLNSKLKSIREGQGDLINPLTGQQDKVYTDKVKQEEGSFASQSFDNLLNVRQQRMFELMAAEENYKNARKQHANIQLNSQNIPYSEYSKLLEASQKEKDRYDNAYYEAKSKFDAVNRSLLLNENPASVERGLASGYGFLPALGEGLVEGFGGNVSTDEDFKQNFVKGLQEKGVSVTKEQVDAAQLNIGQKVGSAIGNSIPAMAQIALAEIATQGAGTLKAIPEIEKIFKAIEAASEANKAFKYGAIMTEGAVKYGLTPSDDLTAAMGAGEELAQKAFDGMNIAPALAKTKWGKFLAIGARSLGGGLAETAAEYGGEYVDALTKNGYNVEEAFKTAVGRDYDEAKDKLLVTFLTSTLFSGTSNVASALVARNYYEAKGDTQRVEEIDNIAKENGIDLEKAKADFDKKVPTPSESTYTKTQEDLIKTTVEQTGKPKEEVEKQLVEEGKIPDLSKENVPTTETPAGKQETTQTQIQDDQENKQGLPSEVQGGQKPITTKPKQETSGRETAPSGVLQTQGEEEVSKVNPYLDKTDVELEKRMSELDNKGFSIFSEEGKEYSAIEKEMEKRERDSVFNVPLEKVSDSIDALMQKEKEMPNGYGSFIEKRDARETKEVADRYLKSSELTDNELKSDFVEALRGNPTTWYADGLKLRESLKEASKRNIATSEMIAKAVKIYTDEQYDLETAKSVVSGMLSPIMKGAEVLSSSLGQVSITTKPKQETSGRETAPSGVLQTQGKEEVNEPSKVESSDYKMQHKIVRDEESTTTLDDMTKGGNLVPDDFYTKPQYYADLSSPSVKESLKVIKEAKGKPEKEITIYRAVPEGVKDINNGDWVSLSETYAKEHGMHPDDPSKDMPVISMKVKASEIVWDGNDVNEFAYFKSEQPVIESETTQQEPIPVATPKQTTLKTAAGKETSTTEENQKQTENENNRGTKKESPTKDFTGNKGKEAEKVRGRGKTPRDKRKIRNEGLKKALASEPKNIRERVLQWFISGGKINTEGFQKLFGDKKTSKWASEARKRINLWDAKKGDTIDGVAHQIWEESGQTLDIQDIRDQVEDVLLSHNVTVSMADEINSANMEEEAIYKSLSEQEQESVDLNEEAEDYWDSLTDEEKEVLVNENILPEDFYKEEKVSPLEKTNTEKAAEAQRMLADKFRKLKIKKPNAGNLFASTPFDLAWDGALEVIAKSLEASASVTEAAGKALEHIKNSDWYKGLTSEQKAKAEQNLKTHIENEMSSFEAEQKPTEEPAKKEEVKVSGEPKAGKERETKKRGTVEQLEKDEVHQDMLKDVPESDKEYVTERVAEWDTDAAEIMNSKDISSARSIFDANKIPPFVRIRLGGMLISKYEELASKETNESERIKYLDAAWDVADLMIKMEAGKTLKAFHGMTLLTPQGIVRGIKRQYEDKAKKAKERNKSVINNINDAVKKGRATAAKEVASEAKKKYKEKIKPITTFGLTIDEIKDRKKAALEKLKASRGNLTSGGLSKESIEAISEYGAMLFAEGIHNFKEWASKMKSDIPEVSNSDLSHIWDNTKSLNDKTLKQLSEEGDFETIVSNHFINNPEASLSEKLQEVFGISPEQAESISESLNKDFKKSAKKHVEDAMGKLTTWRKISVEEIINGNLTEKKDISKAILDAKGIKTELTEEQENELLERAKKIQQVPAGSLRNQAMIDLMNDVSKDLGSTSKTDLFMALWYASILSGPETQLVNTISNVMNMASEGYVSAMQRAFKNKNPKELINAIPNFFKNWNEALSESKEVLSNGTKKAVVFNTADSSVLENTKFKNLLYPLNAAKYVGRVMTATDTLFYFKNLDMRKKTLATEIANKEGLSGEALNKRVSDILYNTEDHIEAAMIQAEKDLADTKNLTDKEYNENDVRIRAAEIIDEKIAKEHPELHDQAHSFAAYATFNYDPEGIIGAAAMKIAEFTTAYPKLKFVLPFTRIVANVLNQALDYSPVTGLRRAAGLTSIKNQTPEAKQRRLIKSLTGLMLMTTAYALHEMYSDDEDPAFEITGGGPEDPAKKREWMQTHKPYSIKIGNTYFSYKYSPIGMTMSILGDWIDGFKYNNISEKDTYERAGYALTSSASSIADMSFISTLGGLLEVFSKNDRKGLETKTDKAVSLGLRPITGLVPNAFKQTYGYFDRTVYETKGIKATLLRDLPFVNSLYLKPKLNALGDPIEKWGTRIVANKPDDEIWNFLSEKNVNIPPIGYGTELLGVEMNDDEYYLFVKKTGGKVKEEITRRLSELRLMKSDELREEIKDISDRAKKKSKKEMIKEIGREELKKRLKK